MPTITRKTKTSVTVDDLTVFLFPKPIAAAVKKFNITEEQFHQAVREIPNPGDHVTVEPVAPAPAAPAVPALVFQVRGLAEPGSSAVAFFSLRDALESNPTVKDPIVCWKGTDRLAALDVDYHGQQSPVRNFHLSCVVPSPLAYWSTRSGVGGRLIYEAGGGFTAEELAACAALYIRERDPKATFEIKSDSRFPPAGTSIRWQTQSNDPEEIRETLHSEVSETVRDEYLEQRGWVVGQQLAHAFCPFNPQDQSTHATCVSVMADGLHCYKCRRTQKFGEIIGTARSSSVLRLMVRNFTHWTHARVILPRVTKITEDQINRPLYSARLKMWHGAEDFRIPLVFTAGRNLIRAVGQLWMTEDLAAVYKTVVANLSTLPVALTPSGEVNRALVETLETQGDLMRYGYPPITPVRGISIFGQYQDSPQGEFPLVVATDNLTSTQVPRYHNTTTPEQETQAWRVWETEFPGLNRRLIQLLIAAKGISEGEVGLAPFIFIYGVSKAGKSSHVNLAAQMCGDRNTEVLWSSNEERMRQAIKRGGHNGTFVTINEILKGGGAFGKKMSPRERFDIFLTTTSRSMSHEMYVGPVPLGKVPVLIATDIDLPDDISHDFQVSRRFVAAQLKRQVEWEASFARFGKNLRANEELAHAANIIVSSVINRWFRENPKPLVQIAEDLGFARMDRADPLSNANDLLTTLYDLVCKAPETTDPAWKKSLRAPGFRIISKNDSTELREVWSELCDDAEGRWSTSRKVAEQDWSRVLGKPLLCEVKGRKGRPAEVAVRFVEEQK